MAFEEPKLDYNLFGSGLPGDNVLKGGVEHSDFNVSGILDEVADNVFKGFLTAGTDLFFRLLRDKGYGRGYDENFGNEGSFYDVYTRQVNSIGNERHHYYRTQSDARSNYTDMDFALDNLTPADVNKIINNSLAIQAKAALKLRQANRPVKNVNMPEFQQNLRNLRLPKGSLFSDREDDDPWAVSLLRLDSLNKLALPIENRDYDDYKDLVHNLNWLKLFKAEKNGGLVSKEVTNRLHQRINRHREASRLYTLEDVAELAKQKMSGGWCNPTNKPVSTDVNKNVSEPVSTDVNKKVCKPPSKPVSKASQDKPKPQMEDYTGKFYRELFKIQDEIKIYPNSLKADLALFYKFLPLNIKKLPDKFFNRFEKYNIPPLLKQVLIITKKTGKDLFGSNWQETSSYDFKNNTNWFNTTTTDTIFEGKVVSKAYYGNAAFGYAMGQRGKSLSATLTIAALASGLTRKGQPDQSYDTEAIISGYYISKGRGPWPKEIDFKKINLYHKCKIAI